MRAVVAVTCFAVSLGACSGDPPAPAPGPTVRHSASPSPSPSPAPVAFAPLTGMPVLDPSELARPVVAAKIENTAAARPQSGLDAADVVYEELTEGGITRFAAVFQSRVPELVGPIRSGRGVDAVVLPPYQSLLALAGARPDVLAALRDAGIALEEEGEGALFRDRSRSAPHNVYATGEDLFARAAAEVPPASPAWSFDPRPPAGAIACPAPSPTAAPRPSASATSAASASPRPAATPTPEPLCELGTQLSVRMSGSARTGWVYDEAAGVYRRSQNGEPDTVTGPGRIGAANVVVLETSVIDLGCCDPAGNSLTDTRVVGEGRGLLMRDGRRYALRWRKSGAGEHFVLTLASGANALLKPGPTWVLLAPTGSVPDS